MANLLGQTFQLIRRNGAGTIQLARQLEKIHLQQHQSASLIIVRPSSFRSSVPVNVADHPASVQVSRDPAEWKFVEAILSKPLVPEPPTKTTNFPSGWQPQLDNVDGLPYFVARTKNHMQPVYLCTYFRGQRRLTKVRRVQGDIWQLERELHTTIVERLGGKEIVSRVNEMSGQIWFKGDYVNIVKEFLASKGL